MIGICTSSRMVDRTLMRSTGRIECLRAFDCIRVCPKGMQLLSVVLMALYIQYLCTCIDATSVSRWPFAKKGGFSLSKRLKSLLDDEANDVSALYGLIFSHFWSFEKDVSSSGLHGYVLNSNLFFHLCNVLQESRTDMEKGFKLMRDRLSKPNFVHEYLLHLAIVYRILRCVHALLTYVRM